MTETATGTTDYVAGIVTVTPTTQQLNLLPHVWDNQQDAIDAVHKEQLAHQLSTVFTAGVFDQPPQYIAVVYQRTTPDPTTPDATFEIVHRNPPEQETR